MRTVGCINSALAKVKSSLLDWFVKTGKEQGSQTGWGSHDLEPRRARPRDGLQEVFWKPTQVLFQPSQLKIQTGPQRGNQAEPVQDSGTVSTQEAFFNRT